MGTRTIPVGEFKTHCLRWLDAVASSGEPLTITQRGRPVARLVPVAAAKNKLFGALAGSVRAQHDLVASADAPWQADY